MEVYGCDVCEAAALHGARARTRLSSSCRLLSSSCHRSCRNGEKGWLVEEWLVVVVETGVVRAEVEVLPLSQVAEVEGCSLFVE